MYGPYDRQLVPTVFDNLVSLYLFFFSIKTMYRQRRRRGNIFNVHVDAAIGYNEKKKKRKRYDPCRHAAYRSGVVAAASWRRDGVRYLLSIGRVRGKSAVAECCNCVVGPIMFVSCVDGRDGTNVPLPTV